MGIDHKKLSGILGSEIVSQNPRVVLIRDNVPGAVRVDRQSRWGNPFVLGIDGTRETLIELANR